METTMELLSTLLLLAVFLLALAADWHLRRDDRRLEERVRRYCGR